MPDFLTHTGAVFALKLTCSVDDLVWLPWLLAGRPRRRRLTVVLTYSMTVLLVAGMSLVAVWLGTDLFQALGIESGWLTAGLGVLLIGYGVLEWRETREATAETGAKTDAEADGTSDADARRQQPAHHWGRLAMQTILITLLGSVDEFGTFAMAVAGLGLGWGSVLLGTVSGTLAVLWLADMALSHPPLVRWLGRLPEWVFLVGLGTLGVGAGLRDIVLQT